MYSYLNENLGIGSKAWDILSEIEEEQDINPFFIAVRGFYISTLKKMLNKFHFGDSLLKDLGVIQPNMTSSYTTETIFGLAKRFPQLGLSEASSLDTLREEFHDFTLSPMDLPTQSECCAADGEMRPKVGMFWWEVGKKRTLYGKKDFLYITGSWLVF